MVLSFHQFEGPQIPTKWMLNQLEIAGRVELRQSNVMMKVMNMMAFNRCFLVSRSVNPIVVLYLIFVLCIKSPIINGQQQKMVGHAKNQTQTIK